MINHIVRTFCVVRTTMGDTRPGDGDLLCESVSVVPFDRGLVGVATVVGVAGGVFVFRLELIRAKKPFVGGLMNPTGPCPPKADSRV